MPLPTRRTILWLLGLTTLVGCSEAKAPTQAESLSKPPSQSPTPTIATEPLPNGLVNVLVLGSDTRDESRYDHARSDTIVIVQLNAARNHLNLVSIPRDTKAAIAGHGRTKINAAYAYGGADLAKQTVSAYLGGLPIHATLETTFERFIAIMGLLGPVTVVNKHASRQLGPVFPAGDLVLQGPDSLAFNRERKGLPAGDYDRTERHRATLTGMLQRLHEAYGTNPAQLAVLVPKLYAKVQASGLTEKQAQGMLPLLKNLDRTRVTSVMVEPKHLTELIGAMKTGSLDGYVSNHPQ